VGRPFEAAAGFKPAPYLKLVPLEFGHLECGAGLPTGPTVQENRRLLTS
jgi:hypothetical protein